MRVQKGLERRSIAAIPGCRDDEGEKMRGEVGWVREEMEDRIQERTVGSFDGRVIGSLESFGCDGWGFGSSRAVVRG
jgi:hypothetical protein